MKDIKCPLCRKKLKMIQPYEYESIMAPGCPECGYQVLDKTDMNNALSIITEIDHYDNTFNDESLEHFISKFPPIMRLKVGDKILYNSCDDDYLAKVNDICRDKNNNVYLKVIMLDSDYEDDVEEYQIIRWPWELEQKGEQEQ